MDEATARAYVIEELGPIAERLGWNASHAEVTAVLRQAADEIRGPLTDLDEPIARALLRYIAWRRAWRALILERGITLPLGGGSVANDVLVERALEQARTAYAEYLALTGSTITVWEVP
jgi:hypothetical protein